jgi:hypothetical protein
MLDFPQDSLKCVNTRARALRIVRLHFTDFPLIASLRFAPGSVSGDWDFASLIGQDHQHRLALGSHSTVAD